MFRVALQLPAITTGEALGVHPIVLMYPGATSSPDRQSKRIYDFPGYPDRSAAPCKTILLQSILTGFYHFYIFHFLNLLSLCISDPWPFVLSLHLSSFLISVFETFFLSEGPSSNPLSGHDEKVHFTFSAWSVYMFTVNFMQSLPPCHFSLLHTYTAVLSRSTVRPIQKSFSYLDIWMNNKTQSESRNPAALLWAFVWQVILLTTFHSRILSASVVIDTRSLFSFWQCWRACSIDIPLITILYSFPFHFNHPSEVQL